MNEKTSKKFSRRDVLQSSAVVTGALVLGGTTAGLAAAQGTEVKNIKCGQTKVGHISLEKDPVGDDQFGNSEDRYRFVLAEPTVVTATVVGNGPGYTQGEGDKGGEGEGEGQETSEPYVAIVEEGGTPGVIYDGEQDVDGDGTAQASAELSPGTYDILVQDAAIVGEQNESFKYQLTMGCAAPSP